MDQLWMETGYFASLGLCALAAALTLLARVSWWRWLGLAALAANLGHVLAMSLFLGRPPLAGGYEMASLLAAWLSLLALISCGQAQAQRLLAGACWLIGALILALFLIFPRKLFPDWYMYQFIWTRLFFSFRWAGLSLSLYAALAALAALAARRAGDSAGMGRLFGWSRNFILLATALFLAGEFSGFTWRLLWLGDYWSWNRNFLEATMFFLMLTAALHLPPRWSARAGVRAAAQAAPGLLMTALLLTHLIMES